MNYLNTFEGFKGKHRSKNKTPIMPLDFDTIRTAFDDIKDNYDLEEIDFEQFMVYVTQMSQIDKFGFHNCCYFGVDRDKEIGKDDGSVSVTIMIKSRDHEEIDAEGAGSCNPIFIKEYPELYNEVINFVKLIENIENTDKPFWYLYARNYKDFSCYHIYIGFKPKSQEHMNGKYGWEDDWEDFDESLDKKEIDPDFLLEAFNDIKDEFDLEKFDKSPLGGGYMFVTEDNWKGDGFTCEYYEPRDMNSKYYKDRRGSFKLKIFIKKTKTATGQLPRIITMLEDYSSHVKEYCKSMCQEVSIYQEQNLIDCSNISVYKVIVNFDIWTPIFSETDYGRTFNMLKSLYGKDDDMKVKLKQLGYDI